MLPESWKAFRPTVPRAGLPLATRTSAGSMPWSIALRTRWVSGSPIFSTTDLSSSVSSPATTSAMSLPSSRATSCTTRWKRLKVPPILTMRSCSALSRTSSTRPARIEVDSSSCASPVRCALVPVLATAMINSPTRSIMRSSLSASTRMERASLERGAVSAVVAAARGGGTTAMAGAGACTGSAVTAAVAALVSSGAGTATISRSQSSRTNSNTSSIAARSASLRSRIWNPR